MSKNYYEILNVDSNASDNVIKKSYRKLAKEYHPDKNSDDKDAEEKFKQLSVAYNTLSDKSKRQQYDYSLKHPNSGGGFQDFNMQDLFRDYEQAFSNFVQSNVSSDVNVKLQVDILSLFKDNEYTIQYPRLIKCVTCDGVGGTELIDCTLCQGNGQIRDMRGMNHKCPNCNGSGKKPSKVCQTCMGSGVQQTEKKLKINIPKGIDNMFLRTNKLQYSIKNMGNVGVDRTGVLNLFIIPVSSDKIILLNNGNIVIKFDIDYIDMILNTELTYNLIDDVNVTFNTKDRINNYITVKEQGIYNKSTNSNFDIIIELNPFMPMQNEVSAKDLKLLKRLKKI